MLLPNHVSIDLIFGWPGQSLEMWLAELKNVLQFCDNHISLYQLTVERGTHLFKLIQKKEVQCADPKVLEEMYLQAVDLLAEHGFERYEVSNFARQQYYSHHNLSYWTGQDYIGIGPGAHGRFTPKDKTLREARIQTLEPNDWIWEVEKYGHATRKRIPLTTQNQLEELLTVGLRTKYGVSNILWSKISPEKSIKELLLNNPRVKYTIEAGLLQFDNRNLKASKEGMNIIDSILPDLLSALEEGIKNNAKQ
ncbi:radical S-adenosyl methionine domain-containing protein 1 [Bulinus truncatus]|nr:radical S-adenosyl methionine domain-containing protein 1 [Bulinus truncatus]